jgi:pimeloyl-ACP methyl ester carboxylesterase
LFSYPSVQANLTENAERLSRYVKSLPIERLHFVGHSLGGLLILEMLARFPDARVQRVILLGSPYRTIYSASQLSRTRFGHSLTGRSIDQWLRQPKPIPGDGYEVGVIAGSRSFGLGRALPGLPRPNDGTVAVEETLVPNMRDHLVLKVSHTELLLSQRVARQVVAFLRHGRFTQS